MEPEAERFVEIAQGVGGERVERERGVSGLVEVQRTSSRGGDPDRGTDRPERRDQGEVNDRKASRPSAARLVRVTLVSLGLHRARPHDSGAAAAHGSSAATMA